MAHAHQLLGSSLLSAAIACAAPTPPAPRTAPQPPAVAALPAASTTVVETAPPPSLSLIVTDKGLYYEESGLPGRSVDDFPFESADFPTEGRLTIAPEATLTDVARALAFTQAVGLSSLALSQGPVTVRWQSPEVPPAPARTLQLRVRPSELELVDGATTVRLPFASPEDRVALKAWVVAHCTTAAPCRAEFDFEPDGSVVELFELAARLFPPAGASWLTAEPSGPRPPEPPDEGTAESALSPRAIAYVVKRARGPIRRCYEAGLLQNPELTGRATLSFEVTLDGKVRGVSAELVELPDPAVLDCVTEVFRGLRFPWPEGAPVTVKTPLRFQSR